MTDLQPSSIPSSGLEGTDLDFLERQLKAELSKRERSNRLAYYRPYRKQIEFHNSGALPIYQRLFMAGNQLGKTMAGAAEVAMHATGRYPDWWQGRRFDCPIVIMCGSESSELTRDGVQRLLVGPPAIEDEWGTGFLPKDMIDGWSRKAGVPNALDSVTVRRVGGGVSQIYFKSYDQGRGKWQATTVHVVWFDEEPPFDVYSEGVTRTTTTQGVIIVTFTPLKGMSQVVKRFLNEPSPHRKVITMSIMDVDHLSAEDKARIISEYPEHEREARANGIPMLGSGAIFPVSDASITCEPIKLQPWFKRIGGMDFGYDHPFGAVDLAHDLDLDIVYVVREFRVRQKTPADHATVLKTWGNLRWAWPHDGHQHDKGSGENLSKQYRKFGMNMLGEHATFGEGGISIEAGLMEMYDRMLTGRWKVFSTCPLWMEEKRMYHRDEGKIIKIDDDLISASRYATMMLRHARTLDRGSPFGVSNVAASATAEGTGTVNW